MTSLFDFHFYAVAAFAGAFGVRFIQTNDISDILGRSISAASKLNHRTEAQSIIARDGSEQGNL